MHRDVELARAIAAAMLRGPFDIESMVARCTQLLGRRWRWLAPLAARVCTTFADRSRPRLIALTTFLLEDERFLLACERHELKLVDRLALPTEMLPVAAAREWRVPAIHTAGALADWLDVSIAELLWFADPRGLARESRSVRRRHYHPRLLAKRFGQVRLIEAPKPRLKSIQRRLLDEILAPIPVHRSAHGFCRARSICSFAAPHVGRPAVLRLDLQDFFPSITSARVAALANLAAYRLDARLSALARSVGAHYTRYADDLAFSGDAEFARVVHRFRHHAAAVALEEGFRVHHRKTRIMRPGVRQHLAGIVVNERPNIARADYDRLKATLANCVRHGPGGQNRTDHPEFRAHLLGRVAHVTTIHPTRGKKLRTLFEQIVW